VEGMLVSQFIKGCRIWQQQNWGAAELLYCFKMTNSNVDPLVLQSSFHILIKRYKYLRIHEKYLQSEKKLKMLYVHYKKAHTQAAWP
jgi:hypothetical protein